MEGSKRIAVLIESNPGSYSRTIHAELLAHSDPTAFSVSCLEVSWPNEAELMRAGDKNGILELCRPYDAVILLSGAYATGIGVLSRFAQHWSPKPLVSIGYRLPGIPSVTLDNRSAQNIATTHLIVAHGRKNLLYLRGRKGNLEAEDRYLGYRRALHERGILFDAARVLDGDFTAIGALNSFAALLTGIEIDGVVAANDDMALAIMKEMLRRGRTIPQDVSFIGFDNVDYAKTAMVPLSSIAQPFEGFARAAFASLHQQFSGSPTDMNVMVEAGLVTRASCGCRGG